MDLFASPTRDLLAPARDSNASGAGASGAGASGAGASGANASGAGVLGGRIAFLGAGAMGEALAGGLLEAGLFAPRDLVLYDVASERVAALAARWGARAANSALEAVKGARFVLLAVKPSHVEPALAPLREALTGEQTLISIAAGVALARLEALLAPGVPVVRAMPNTPALVGASATALCGGTSATRDHIGASLAIFGALGLAIETSESALDAVTGLSGSGPAYVFVFIEALTDAGVREGLSRDVAHRLAAQTVLGAARLVLESGEHPAALKDRVASPGGTTIAGLCALEERAFRGAVIEAVSRAAARSRELGA